MPPHRRRAPAFHPAAFGLLLATALLLPFPRPCGAGKLEDALKALAKGQSAGPLDEKTAADGIREALRLGSGKAVDKVGVPDGYFGNSLVRIAMPEELKQTEKLLRKLGQGKSVDEFVLSMNRAAERAAPAARDILVGAVREMTLSDALAVVRGSETAATDYFRGHTTASLTAAFRPPVTAAMDEVGVTRAYKKMAKKVESLPLVKVKTVDLDSYVTDRALAGLFTMVAEEEKRIRRDPAARVTELLRRVFAPAR